ncbi:EAL domain-containing protein [Neorhizobium sp. JUb45]|uniref:bifunctional diguanylate cyclase/phosphodiesterase n=1 Tax=unclassified Neorhizobium TaxID=2629175 RepID=UPI00104E2DFB|nr:EAL domain-containing protein [Neorhizobium sp. JUb45]TCR06815.1 periplasmic sensor diguanylate cyclase/phosphodiesterase [Neorhizobium sp. JUb45]
MSILPSPLTFRDFFSGRFHQLGYILPAILVMTVVAVGIVRAVQDEHERHMWAQRLSASEQLAQVSSMLETNIHGNVNLIHGLVAAIAADPSINQAQFAQLAEHIFAHPSQLKNVAAAPDLVVRMIYPLAENREILGQDYTANPKQSASVMEAIKRRTTTIAGPAKLVQGGKGLFARYPVFLSSNGHFWGVVSTVIDIDRLLRDSNVDTERQQLEISIARRPVPKEKDVFFGDAGLFSQDVVRTRIELGYDTWYLAARPKLGWQTTPPDIARLYIYATLVALTVFLPTIWVGFLIRQRQGHIQTLQQREEQLQSQNDELRSARRTLEHQSLHDALTGLPNRRFLDQFMDASAATSESDRLAFVHIDLDRFKEVNDTFGHAAGDQVLRQTTTRLQALLHGDEFASRIGGDEFVLVTSGTKAADRALQLARAVVKALARPIIVDGHECHVGCSAGVAAQSVAGEDLRQLLINADIALYEAKKRGRNRAEIFSENLLLAAIHTKRSSDELLVAIENDQIVPFFQPQFDARTLGIVGVEALARWQHPTRGILTPDKFLDIAEGLHRSGDIDAIILQKALFQATRWRARDLNIPHLSVNISAQRLKDENLLAQISSLNIPKGSLSFELLESISFDGQDKALRSVIGHLKDLGIDIEIDDFGSGHASIVSLLDLDPKRLKIDRRLIMPLEASGSQHRLVASIIEIGRSQGIEIVAEGVETTAHVEILRNLGCHVLQGYAFAKPMSAEAFVEFAENWQAERGDLFSHARQSA